MKRLEGGARPGTGRSERQPRPAPPDASNGPARVGVDLWALLRAMRPLQWTKNAVVLAALVFAGDLFAPGQAAQALAAAVVFCLASSAGYLLNDLRDVAADRVHPRKRTRPLAAGLISPRQAIVAAVLLLALALAGAWAVAPLFLLVILAYAAMGTAYTFGLKRLVILDVFAIAAGFVLRAVGGAVAIDVPVSPWLYVCTGLLALFLGFGKRRHELSSLEENAGRHRASLESYSLPLLDQIIAVAAAATVIAYALYTIDAPNLPANGTMLLTIPFVLYAILRYLFLVQRRDLGGAPEALLFADRPLLLAILGWGLTCVAILYLAPR